MAVQEKMNCKDGKDLKGRTINGNSQLGIH